MYIADKGRGRRGITVNVFFFARARSRLRREKLGFVRVFITCVLPSALSVFRRGALSFRIQMRDNGEKRAIKIRREKGKGKRRDQGREKKTAGKGEQTEAEKIRKN